ncbi:MAG: SEL1-like repeat protein [Gammaproteobacteria bacterium]|nr:SEL1-like repeat protein [Gammaproteobacteria bacterium]NND37777.1 sel1 repeat family protein [Gammaproteobacteria bacterium]
MMHMRLPFLLFPCWFACVATAVAAPEPGVLPGECRAALRPLLLQNPPPRDELLAVRSFCVAQAEAGDADAEYQLAMFYLGLVDWDVDQAVPMIQSAARNGVPEAQYWLAWQYDEGPLLPNDAQLALQWYRAAGENEHRLALTRLAVAYQNGDLGLAIDENKALEMRAKAEACANQGG